MKAFWSGGTTAPSTSAVNYAHVTSNMQSGWTAYENTFNGFHGVSIPLSENIVITKLTTWVSAAPGGAASWNFKVRNNATDTAASLTITGAATTASWTGSLSCSISDLINLSCTPAGTPAASPNTYWTIEYSTLGNYYLMPSGNGSPVSSTGTYYYSPYGYNILNASTTATDQESIIPTSLTATRIATIDDQSVGGTFTYYVRNNTTATDSTFSAVVTGTQSVSSTGLVTFSPGDTMVIKEVRAGSAFASFRSCITIVPNFSGEIVQTYGNTYTPSSSAINYDQPIGGGSGAWNAAESAVYTRLSGGIVSKLYVKLATPPGASASRTFTIRSNTADTVVTTTISGTNVTGNDTTDNTTHPDGNFLSISTTPTGTPATTNGVKFGFVLTVSQPSIPAASNGQFFSMFNK